MQHNKLEKFETPLKTMIMFHIAPSQRNEKMITFEMWKLIYSAAASLILFIVYALNLHVLFFYFP